MQRMGSQRRRPGFLSIIVTLMIVSVTTYGCARLPYTTEVVQQNERVEVKIQHEVERKGYTHPLGLSTEDLRRVLSGFSAREKKKVPLRWFAEEVPPRTVFRQDELDVLVRPVAEALEKAGPEERVYFTLRAPGPNPNYDQDVTAGWVAFRDPYLHFDLDYFHTLLPVRKIDQYDYNFPLTNPNPQSYLLYFEPGRFWVVDPASGDRTVNVRELLKAGGAHLVR
jgi:hypothetical protein